MSATDPLEPPDTHRLSAAVGWLELGNLAEAKAELDAISPAFQWFPDVLEVRWLLCAEQKEWPEAVAAARALLHYAPERASGWLHCAYAVRRMAEGGLQKAWEALRPAFEKFPDEPIIAYNLSCYACQLNRLVEAREWFQRALAIGDKVKIKQMALADTDLKPLWGEIRET